MEITETFACTLDLEAGRERAAQLQTLSTALMERSEDARRAVLRFLPHAEPAVRRFVADESSCCSFFIFNVRRDDDHVELSITTPAGAEPMLAALVAGFDPRTSAEAKANVIAEMRDAG